MLPWETVPPRTAASSDIEEAVTPSDRRLSAERTQKRPHRLPSLLWLTGEDAVDPLAFHRVVDMSLLKMQLRKLLKTMEVVRLSLVSPFARGMHRRRAEKEQQIARNRSEAMVRGFFDTRSVEVNSKASSRPIAPLAQFGSDHRWGM